MRSDWRRVTKQHPCPICGKPDWCLVSADGTAAICPRVSDGAEQEIRGSGWLHKVGGQPVTQLPAPPPARKRSTAELGALMQTYKAAATKYRRENLANRLGVAAPALTRLGMGWSEPHGAWAFPMYDQSYGVCGIHLRDRDGNKRAVSGSSNGLFLPSLSFRGILVVCEGLSDTAAMITLGFEVVGRQSCLGQVGSIAAIVGTRIDRHGYSSVAIMADADRAGRQGARTLAAELPPIPTRIVTPPDGLKDARAWLNAGAKREDVVDVIRKTSAFIPRRLSRERGNKNRGQQPANGPARRRNEAASATRAR